MAKKINIFFWNFLLIALLGLSGHLFGQKKSELQAADAAWENKNWQEAREIYSASFENDDFTETSLLRLAWIHEQAQEYPLAIFYLKKSEKHFGGAEIPEKIRHLMLLEGASRTFTPDPLLQIKTRFGWVFLLAFGLAILWYAFHLFVGRKNPIPEWRKNLNWFAHILFVPLCLLLVWQIFFPPTHAVLIEPTTFYERPGYGAPVANTIFSPGETVEVTGKKDIWVKVSVGGANYWVPEFTIREL